jgi:hypothetical protein
LLYENEQRRRFRPSSLFDEQLLLQQLFWREKLWIQELK